MQRKKNFRSKFIFMLIVIILSLTGKAYSAELIISFAGSDHGPESGGKSVTIVGSSFLEGATVNFGGIPATDVEVYYHSWITCKTPAHEAGSVDITVTNPDGQSVTCTSCYTYDPAPKILEISPIHGPASGGTVVNIIGENFFDSTAVAFGGISGKNIEFISDTEMSCVAPKHEAGAVDVTVSNPDRQMAVCEACYTYDPPPVINSMSPDHGPETGGTEITITGSAFTEGTDVSFSGVSASNISIVSDTEIKCIAPPNTANATISVTNPDGQSAFCAKCYFYDPPPRTTFPPILPDHGPISGSTEIIVRGENFAEGTKVSFGDKEAGNITVNADKISCKTPVNLAGQIDVAISNPDGQTTVCPNCYTYTPFSVSPEYGDTSGGTEVTIKGENFTDDIEVFFGDTPAADLTVISSSEIKCASPEHETGTADISVSHSEVQISVCSDCYTYLTKAIPIKIGTACEPQELNCANFSAKLWISGIMSLNPVQRVWARITPPDVLNGSADPGTEKPSIGLEASDNDGVYEGTYENFSQTGTYKIGFFVQDSEGRFSEPLETSVTRICQKGDVDRSGDVDLKDALAGLKVLTETSITFPNRPAYKVVDTDGDEKIGLAEVVYILKNWPN